MFGEKGFFLSYWYKTVVSHGRKEKFVIWDFCQTWLYQFGFWLRCGAWRVNISLNLLQLAWIALALTYGLSLFSISDLSYRYWFTTWFLPIGLSKFNLDKEYTMSTEMLFSQKILGKSVKGLAVLAIAHYPWYYLKDNMLGPSTLHYPVFWRATELTEPYPYAQYYQCPITLVCH